MSNYNDRPDDDEEDSKSGTDKLNEIGGTTGGAVTGAAIGSMFGPLGMLVGGFLGSLIGNETAKAGNEARHAVWGDD